MSRAQIRKGPGTGVKVQLMDIDNWYFDGDDLYGMSYSSGISNYDKFKEVSGDSSKIFIKGARSIIEGLDPMQYDDIDYMGDFDSENGVFKSIEIDEMKRTLEVHYDDYFYIGGGSSRINITAGQQLEMADGGCFLLSVPVWLRCDDDTLVEGWVNYEFCDAKFIPSDNFVADYDWLWENDEEDEWSYIYEASAKKMKKGHGNYYDAIENFIVDNGEVGPYYNDIYDEFIDVLTEDDIMDAIEYLINEGTICYNENNERFEVCAKGVRKMKMNKKYYVDDYYVSDNPEQKAFIDEVLNNGKHLRTENFDNGGRIYPFEIYEYNGEEYEVLHGSDGIDDMYRREPEPDYSVLTFDLFKKTIEDYLKAYSDDVLELDEYTFHDEGNGHYTFSYDGLIYELMNYGNGDFKWGLHDALENAGFEWGVNIDQDTYSDIGFYDHSKFKASTKKSYVPDLPSFRDMTDKMRNTRTYRIGE